MVLNVFYTSSAHVMGYKLVKKLSYYAIKARRAYVFELSSIWRRFGGLLEDSLRRSADVSGRLGEGFACLGGVL